MLWDCKSVTYADTGAQTDEVAENFGELHFIRCCGFCHG